MEMISVIVPVYNVEQYLEKCIDSILAQTYTELEVILVDDGSSDRSGQICDYYKEMDSRVIVIHQKNQGVSAARNVGLDKARGEYIGFVDSDDYIEKNMYEVLYRNAKESGAEISYCGLKQVQVDGKIEYINNSGQKKKITREEAIKGFFYDERIKAFMYSQCNKIYHKDLLRDIRYDSRLAIGEDILFMFQCLEQCNYLFMEDVCLYNYMRRENSAMTSKFSDKRMDYVIAAELIEKACRENYPFALTDAMRWCYTHKLITCRNLIVNTPYKKKYLAEFEKMKTYLRNEKGNIYPHLPIKRKLDYWFVMYLPFMYYVTRRVR